VEITWYGHSCFRLSEKQRATVVTDPFDESIGYPLPKLKADVVTVSHDAPGHNNVNAVKSITRTISGAGEYEIGGVFIIGVPLHNTDPEHLRSNIAYLFDFGDLTVAHLGDMSRVPEQSEIEALGSIHIALVPVGGGSALNSTQAAQVIALLEPRIVIPMHYQTELSTLPLEPIDRFLKEMGVSHVQHEDMLKITGATLPETPQIVMLNSAR